MEAICQLLARLQGSYATLSSREQKMVAGAGGAGILFVLFLVIFGFSTSANAIRSRTAGS